MPRIDVSDATYRRLLKRCVSFEDTAEHVIERLLEGAPRESGPQPGRTERQSSRTGRATPGSILPERAYWLPILGVIADAGGSAAATDVIDVLAERMGDLFKRRDLDLLSMGEVRWRNRARFARLRMKEHGFLSDRSPRGIWEITDAGRQLLASG